MQDAALKASFPRVFVGPRRGCAFPDENQLDHQAAKSKHEHDL